ncbi:inorganic phosphate transporter [Oceanihabitans sediminis]|uniref:Phosphate transporter n=1 Tax=Oceanihabitans sediminis TaxID=1812012 RepID=A0A368P8J4_9FLAO|nr:inorganic phosphate transporter [Oceanihabitans sediminis]MDX1278576.1 inorganic phosphate transporter [Oceanihabitans sediminis]MDX1772777.1 inorganic phosphate transporter [Oceanihabitans sediminis]RBP34448.1 phosphate transporter family protein [Oceanihabitans sediminis]RCU58119.1 inorganic phosphate transporter [Oceanihabitans sediminis]
MENIYLYMIIALAILAIADLVVGVSNDAVNFLNSAIGSKAISFKTIMIVASLGVAVGAIFSSGMMEVARKGIFNPGEFMFNEIMIIFMAVMITDILLLDFFNTIGLPTSTTVSIVFELLGASVAMALIKIGHDGGTFVDLLNYINTSKAAQIIFGILLSVVIAFSVGALVQWVSRLLLSYNFEKKAKWISALFGGFALTSITYFIFIKGLKGTSYASESFSILGGETMNQFLEHYAASIIAVSFIIWSLLSFLLVSLLKLNIYRIIIIVGTFALALAFAGNDLVNFIGVPMAAFSAFEQWSASGMPATEFPMGVLAEKVTANNWLLFAAGMIMVLTLWFSTKAKNVVKTSLDLSSQGETKERFQPNFLSRGFVRVAVGMSQMSSYILPETWQTKIEKQFEAPVIKLPRDKVHELPAFDMVRAAVNLMVAAVLISLATSYKLPLSTTYVTFMVAMGTSLADRAWGAESAVYRVAGVLNVIGGWFFTALSAFVAAALVAYLLNLNLEVMFPILLVAAFGLLIRNYISHNKKSKEVKEEDSLTKAESSSVQGVIHESAKNIANVVKRGNRIYTNAIKGLAKQDLALLKKNKKQVVKLSNEIDELRDNIFYFIKNLDESSVGASNFYINVLGYLQDMAQSLEYISKVSHKHINNNHKKLKFNQIKELKQVDNKVEVLFDDIKEAFDSESFEKIGAILDDKTEVYNLVKQKIQAQVARTRSEESSPKNTTLYFGLLLETKDLLNATMNLLEEYHGAHDSSIKPAVLGEENQKH